MSEMSPKSGGPRAPRRIAVVGGGVSGLVTAYLLNDGYDVRLFEAGPSLGGHTRTEEVEVGGRTYAVDMGFIVYNERNYPGFTALLDRLKVASRPTEMSFSVRCPRTRLEYNGHNLNTLFAQRQNLWNLSFLRMLAGILRFNRRTRGFARRPVDPEMTLGRFLLEQGLSRELAEWYVLPMGAALWSASRQQMLAFPLGHFTRFLDNHGLLDLWGRPQWRTLVGGSKVYVERLAEILGDKVRTSCPVASIRRTGAGAEVTLQEGGTESFDAVVLAVHSDQALKLLADPSLEEAEILGALPYERNEVLLHTDTSVLPESRRAWASWNYLLAGDSSAPATVTYNMNILQGFDAPETFCVTLNLEGAVDPRRILRRVVFEHPQYTIGGERARARRHEINGVRNTFYCGAYWGSGFHEDGVESAREVCRLLGRDL